ncbi:MAG: hypothetical protein DHS20C21_12930 [Gemmatimonadota bacterium]|nr:MAG: hypothetical protein DHS20C21_12930 [Gemmatimonadota bacterium]
MRKYFMTAFVLVAMLVFATSGLALEKTNAQLTDGRGADGWNAGTTCSVSYFNTCTGWLWVWSGWAGGDVLGMCYDPCCTNGAQLDATGTYIWTGALPGYGFTGTIEVSTADANCCPDVQLAQQVFLPVSGLNVHAWGVPASGPVVLTMTLASATGAPSPVVVPSDHPAAGPTGPAAWGFCYPTPRTVHSFYYGNTNTGTICPGSALNDGVGTAEWLSWSAAFSCPVSVEESSWGSVKNLYR